MSDISVSHEGVGRLLLELFPSESNIDFEGEASQWLNGDAVQEGDQLRGEEPEPDQKAATDLLREQLSTTVKELIESMLSKIIDSKTRDDKIHSALLELRLKFADSTSRASLNDIRSAAISYLEDLHSRRLDSDS